MRIVTGPVVGAVDSNSARILLEPEGGEEVVARASPKGGGAAVTARTSRHPDCPVAVAKLEGLSPGTVYEVDFSDDGGRRARFVTPAIDQDPFCAFATSCNDVAESAASEAIWRLLADRVVTDPAHVILHMGDQVYGDKVYSRGVEMLKAGHPGDDDVYERAILKSYRDLYRRTWNVAATRFALASAPNLMIWDDHEVVDDWGDLEYIPGTPEHRVASIGWRVMREYERQLWSDADPSETIYGAEDHAHVMGRVGIYFLDNRGGRAFRDAAHPDPRPYLSEKQWTRLTASLAHGPLHDVDTLIVVAPVPIAFISTAWIDAYPLGINNDIRGHWSYQRFAVEQHLILQTLSTWKRTKPGRRLVIAAGDVHVGGRFRIREANGAGDPVILCEQLVSSPIGTAPMTDGEESLIRGLVGRDAEPWTEPPQFDWICLERRLVNKRNFGTIRITKTDIVPTLVTA